MKKYYIAMVVLFLLSALAIGWNISVTKDPANDNLREADITALEGAVDSYVTKNDKLPASLSAVTLTGGVKDRVGDYEYKKGAGGKYQLCTTFKTDTTKQTSPYRAADLVNPEVHKTGRVCFDYEAYGLDLPTSSPVSPAVVPEDIASVCDTKLPASSSMTQGAIAKLDTKAASVAIEAEDTYTWKAATAPPVYNTGCQVIGMATLGVGDDVDVYYSSSKTVLAIQSYK